MNTTVLPWPVEMAIGMQRAGLEIFLGLVAPRKREELVQREPAQIEPVMEFGGVRINESATASKTFSMDAIRQGTEFSGDKNPLHRDEAFAKTTIFKGIIAPGNDVEGQIVAAIGSWDSLKGCALMEKHFFYRAPVRPGNTVVAKVTAVEFPKPGKPLLRIGCEAKVGETVVIEGHILVRQHVPK